MLLSFDQRSHFLAEVRDNITQSPEVVRDDGQIVGFALDYGQEDHAVRVVLSAAGRPR